MVTMRFSQRLTIELFKKKIIWTCIFVTCISSCNVLGLPTLRGTNQVLSVCICSPCPHNFKVFFLLFLKCFMLNKKKRDICARSMFSALYVARSQLWVSANSWFSVHSIASHIGFFFHRSYSFFHPVTFLITCYLLSLLFLNKQQGCANVQMM